MDGTVRYDASKQGFVASADKLARACTTIATDVDAPSTIAGDGATATVAAACKFVVVLTGNVVTTGNIVAAAGLVGPGYYVIPEASRLAASNIGVSCLTTE